MARQAQTIPGQGVLLDQPPKSDAGYRTVPLARETVDTVALHPAAYPPRAGLVLTTSAGTPVHRQVFSDAWTHRRSSGPGSARHCASTICAIATPQC